MASRRSLFSPQAHLVLPVFSVTRSFQWQLLALTNPHKQTKLRTHCDALKTENVQSSPFFQRLQTQKCFQTVRSGTLTRFCSSTAVPCPKVLVLVPLTKPAVCTSFTGSLRLVSSPLLFLSDLFPSCSSKSVHPSKFKLILPSEFKVKILPTQAKWKVVWSQWERK